MPTEKKKKLPTNRPGYCKLHDSGQICVVTLLWLSSKINGHIYRIDRSLI